MEQFFCLHAICILGKDEKYKKEDLDRMGWGEKRAVWQWWTKENEEHCLCSSAEKKFALPPPPYATLTTNTRMRDDYSLYWSVGCLAAPKFEQRQKWFLVGRDIIMTVTERERKEMRKEEKNSLLLRV